MQIKKYEAPTLQEALDAIKRELGPEAIILKSKTHKRGFGLMSKPSVEVTVAVSDRSLHKKKFLETRMPARSIDVVRTLTAERQAEVYDTYIEKHLEKAAKGTRDVVDVGGGRTAAVAIAATKAVSRPRYIDIPDAGGAARPQAAPGPAAPVPRRTEAPVEAADEAARFARSSEIRSEVDGLKRMILELKGAQETAGTSGSGISALVGERGSFTPALQNAFEQLVVEGVDKRYALGLIRKVSFALGTAEASNPDRVVDRLATEIMEDTEVMSLLDGITRRATSADGAVADGDPAVIAFVGPTGVGKTTTIAKLASDALLKRKLRVGLVNVDMYKVGAPDSLSTYARILGLPFRSVRTGEELADALRELSRLDLVLVDTTGRSQKDGPALRELEELLRSVPAMRTELVLSASTRDNELYDMGNRFSLFRPEGLVITKLDEATIHGAVYNVSQRLKLPLICFTTGQRVPEDIEDATKERVAALVMSL